MQANISILTEYRKQLLEWSEQECKFLFLWFISIITMFIFYHHIFNTMSLIARMYWNGKRVENFSIGILDADY